LCCLPPTKSRLYLKNHFLSGSSATNHAKHKLPCSRCLHSASAKIDYNTPSLLRIAAPCRLCAQFYISGHSLGGAIATLAAYEISRLYPDHAVIIYTFGSPRVGNASGTLCVAGGARIFLDLCRVFLGSSRISPNSPSRNLGFGTAKSWESSV